MTHANIFEKLMIEYDKANITSSYPSLTDYEIATVLDKAYLALIALKITGMSFRKSQFEADAKAIEDIQNLITRATCESKLYGYGADNEHVYKTPADYLYYVGGTIKIDDDAYNVSLVSHQIAEKYKVTANNLPWVKQPVCYIENNDVHVLIDSYTYKDSTPEQYTMQYVKKPNSFVDDYELKSSTFELNESMAEELINLAIIMSLEIVESTRLDNKIKTSNLES